MARNRALFGRTLWLAGLTGLILAVMGLSAPVLAQSTSFVIAARVENGTQGSISPSGDVVVVAGGSQTFVVTPNPGYSVAFLTVDGRSQGAISSFTFTNVNSGHTISAGFSLKTYTVKVTAGPNGSISPNGFVQVEHGTSHTFTVIPDAGYKIDNVMIDDAPQGAIDKYTFANVGTDHTISATFVAVSSGTGTPGTGTPMGPGVTDLTGLISGEGLFVQTVIAGSADGRVKIVINRGTTAVLGIGQTLTRIEIAGRSGTAQTQGLSIVGDAYDVMPESATLDLAAGLSIGYDPSLVPKGAVESKLALARWESRSGDWTTLIGSVSDPSSRSVSAPVTGFGRYAVVAPAAAAVLTAKDLEISPEELPLGGRATVAVTVTNDGDRSGTFSVALKVNGSVSSTRDVTLAGGASERIEFSVPGDVPGSFVVSVENLSGALRVVAAPATTLNSSSPSGTPFSFGMVPGFISAAALVAVLILTILRRRSNSMVRPAAFVVKDLEIAPNELQVGGKATVAVTVTNKGGRAGSFRVVVKVNGSIAASKDVTLAASTSDRVELSIPGAAAGSFSVSVEDLTGTLTVMDAPATGLTYSSA